MIGKKRDASSDTHAHQGMPSAKPKLNRRDLLQGRLWKLIRPQSTGQSFQPLVMRYPTSPTKDFASTSPPCPPPKSIAGIAIEPVGATRLDGTPQARTLPIFRPPGAVEETQFLAGCTRCNDCADACPHQAIVPASQRLGTAGGTPTINADTSACQMCQDFPCITACKVGVLSDCTSKVIGTAKITEHLCLAYHSMTCTVCSERCPSNDVIQVVDGKPLIDEETCTGCGVCRYVCPAPENAVLLMPLLTRPSRST